MSFYEDNKISELESHVEDLKDQVKILSEALIDISENQDHQDYDSKWVRHSTPWLKQIAIEALEKVKEL